LKNPQPDEAVRRGRLKLALLGAFFVVPFLAGTLAWWLDWVPGTPANYGTLIAPRPVAPLPGGAKGKWVLVQFAGGACNAACEKKLYIMRQVRRAQAKEMTRIERLWLVTDAARPRPELLAAIEGTILVPAGALAAQFPAERSVEEHIYLVDPLGNLMLRFPREPEPARVIQDLKRLLRVSGFG
jgi:ferric-dicitrate binding protein FerR (iron transport regulator)